jgi:hypothetical protein
MVVFSLVSNLVYVVVCMSDYTFREQPELSTRCQENDYEVSAVQKLLVSGWKRTEASEYPCTLYIRNQ